MATTTVNSSRSDLGQSCSSSGTDSASPKGITLRDYQSRIVAACEKSNTIVVLPTGSGKTIIAGEAIRRLGPPALFLVPTCLLVDQQSEALRAWTGLDVYKYRGGLALPTSFDILVTTPEAFKTAQCRHEGTRCSGSSGSGGSSYHLQWPAFRAVIFDEVHHVLKDHPYRKLALSLRRSSRGQEASPSLKRAPRVIGLTASYTYAIGDVKVKASLNTMCRELLITNTETSSRQELQASGYQALGGAAEVVLTSTPMPQMPVPEGVVPEADRKPHEMALTFFGREKRGEGTRFARQLMACVRSMEQAVLTSSTQSSFSSPLSPSGKFSTKEWGVYAHKLARGGRVAKKGTDERKRNGGDLPVRAGGDISCPMLAEMEHWYEAVKSLVVSWEEAEDEAATILDMGGCREGRTAAACTEEYPDSGQSVEAWPQNVLRIISAFWAEVPEKFPRYEHLKSVLMEKYLSHGGDGNEGGASFKGIVFVRQRVTTHVLAHVIRKDAALGPLFSSACLYASSSPATASLSVSKSSTQAHLRSFRDGHVNLLLATVVAEEGMDIPAANCTIRFDAMENAVSLVQGRGRARQEGSSFVVLKERRDRTTADLEAVEQEQLRLIQNFKPTENAVAEDALIAAQRSRERSARGVLLNIGAQAGANSDSSSMEPISDASSAAFSAINLFAKKTKVVLEESANKSSDGLWECTLTYESVLREVHATGRNRAKKISKRLAAVKILEDLLAVVPE